MSSNPIDPNIKPGGPLPASAEKGSTWPRRRVLQWGLGLAPILAGGGVAAFRWREKANDDARAAPLTQAASRACFAGHPDAAAQVDGALRVSRDYAPALLLRACLALEAGRGDIAKKFLERPALKSAPESKFLLAVAEHRPRASDWRHVFFDAWKALGEPDFSKSPLLPEPVAPNILLGLPEQSWDEASEEQRFALAALEVAVVKRTEGALWLSKKLSATTSLPMLMGLFIQLTDSQTPPDLRDLLLDEVKERLQQLAGASPPTLQLALLAFLDGRPATAPFQRADLEALERIVAIPVWKQTSNEQLFQEMHSHFEGLLLAPGHHAWRMVLLATGVALGSQLYHRAEASTEHLTDDDQRWMGRLLWDVGTRLREQRSDMEMDMGVRLQMFSSELTRYVPNKEASVNHWVELGIWEKAVERAGCYRWPMPSLQEEFYAARARNEEAWMTAFAGVGALP